MSIPRGFRGIRPYIQAVYVFERQIRQFDCPGRKGTGGCGRPVTTVAPNKRLCDRCQIEQNRQSARDASKKQTAQKNKSNSTITSQTPLTLQSCRDDRVAKRSS
jgi:hypothetical protein